MKEKLWVTGINVEMTNPPETNFAVVAFFVLGSVATTFIAWRFASGPEPIFKRFGYGLVFIAAALATWAVIVWIRPDNLHAWASVGVALFLPSVLFFLGSAIDGWSPKNRKLTISVVAVCIVGLFIARTFLAPSDPSFSERGLFYFNARPIALLAYVFVFAGTLLPAVYAVSRKIADRTVGRVTFVAFNLIILCGIVRLTSYDDDLQTYNGVLMGAGFVALLVLYIWRNPVAATDEVGTRRYS